MCGIHGVFHYRGGQPDRALIERMGLVQRHRGPDDSGLWMQGACALGHRRLSIVDLSPGGHQPMPDETEQVWVAFNGELYNWPQVQPQLAARGHRFRGHSDTEMLLHLWQEKGAAMLEDLRGMFSIALFDVQRQQLLLARDRVGKKPLFYHDDGKRVVFASELKCLMADPSVPRDVDPRALADYLTFRYVPAPRSIWSGVQKVPAGHRVLFDASGARVERYWSLPAEVRTPPSPEAAVERLRELLREAVRIRLMSDVPLGAFLSGGIDSSAIVALMSEVSSTPVRTFSIGFEEEEHSELEHARTVARHLGTDHQELIVRPRALDLMPRLVWGMDEPFADASMIPTYHVADMARRHVTVALSGDGGDEACAGYDTYTWAEQYAPFDAIPRTLRRLLAWPIHRLAPDHPLGRKLHRVALDTGERHLEMMSEFSPPSRVAIMSASLREAAIGYDPYATPLALHRRAQATLGAVPALCYLDAMTYMIDDVLVKVDRASMMHSLEVRSPLLDQEVLQYLASLPFDLKVRGGVRKWILREAVRPLLPPAILQRGKQGFGVPLGRWFGGSMGRLAREVLLDQRARGRGWLDTAAVERLLSGTSLQDPQIARRAFTLVCLELWAQTYVDRPREALDRPMDGPLALHPAVQGPASA